MVVFQGNGFGVQIPGRAGLLYTEGSRTMRVSGEMLMGAVDFVIYRSSLGKWDDSNETANEVERARILGNIVDLLRRNGLVVEVQ